MTKVNSDVLFKDFAKLQARLSALEERVSKLEAALRVPSDVSISGPPKGGDMAPISGPTELPPPHSDKKAKQ